MGEAAVRSHMKGQKHCELKKRQSSLKLKSFFPVASTSSSQASSSETSSSSRSGELANVSETPPSSSMAQANVTGELANVNPTRPSSSSTATGMGSFVTKTDCLKSELLWCLNVMDKHYSYRSCEDVNKLFQRMFPDSELAKSFTCGERKCAYLSCYGLAPYFKSMLMKQVEKAGEYVLLFDESLNHKSQSKQMDVHVRLWENDRVGTRYFGSQFMGHADADTMLQHFSDCVEKINMRNLVQVSMDGPNVNWKFIESLQEQLRTDCDSALLNIGSCGLHIVNGAFRTGFLVADWRVTQLLSSLYWLFKDTPARREDYTQACEATGNVRFPLKFCQHRWLENIPVAERVLEILPSVNSYVKQINEKKLKDPKTKSYTVVKEMCGDPLLTAKVKFFLSVAKQLSPFLTAYQTDAPMLPFICEDMHRMIRGLMQRFIKSPFLKEAPTVVKLMKIDPSKKENHCDVKKIDVGFVTENILKDLLAMKRSASCGCLNSKPTVEIF